MAGISGEPFELYQESWRLRSRDRTTSASQPLASLDPLPSCAILIGGWICPAGLLWVTSAQFVEVDVREVVAGDHLFSFDQLSVAGSLFPGLGSCFG
jgi:hypothetical protein